MYYNILLTKGRRREKSGSSMSISMRFSKKIDF